MLEQRPRGPNWRVWPALLLAPLLALGYLSLAYALVTPSCEQQSHVALTAFAALALVLVLAMTALAWRSWARMAAPQDAHPAVTCSDSTRAVDRPRFVALVATLAGALSALVIVALWLPQWLLSPCG